MQSRADLCGGSER